MKIALYIDEGLEQIVLTPETDTEKSILGKLHDDSRELRVYRGEFYACAGGWMRHSMSTSLYGYSESGGGNSSIVVLARKSEPS